MTYLWWNEICLRPPYLLLLTLVKTAMKLDLIKWTSSYYMHGRMNPGRRMNKENVENTGRWPAALISSNQNHWEMMVTISFVTVYVLVGSRGYIYTWWSRMVMTFNFLPVVFLAFTCPSWNWYLLFSWERQIVDKKQSKKYIALILQLNFKSLLEISIQSCIDY